MSFAATLLFMYCVIRRKLEPLDRAMENFKRSYKLACVAGGIVSAREIKFWRRSRHASGEAARRMVSRAPTIPPATQANISLHDFRCY